MVRSPQATRLGERKGQGGLRALIAIPVYNEEKHLERVLAEVVKYSPEVLAVNDGSTDNTLPKLLGYVNSNSKVTVINLSRNFGKEAAMAKSKRT